MHWKQCGSWFIQEKPADQDPSCLQVLIWFHTVFERINSSLSTDFFFWTSKIFYGQVHFGFQQFLFVPGQEENFIISTPLSHFIQIFLRNSISPFEPFFSTLNDVLNYWQICFFLLPLFKNIYDYYVPAMIMGGALSVTPVRTHVSTCVCPNDVRSLNRILLIRILWN